VENPVSLGEFNIGNGTNGIMEMSDCFCIDFVFETTCGYEGTLPHKGRLEQLDFLLIWCLPAD